MDTHLATDPVEHLPPSSSPSPPGPFDSADGWRIDDLAQRAGIAVDTIRYYQREGLLAPGERVGRSLRYGPEHLDRLERIKALQARRFSLAAIRALLDHSGSIEDLLAGREGETFDREALVAAAGVSPELVQGLERAGLLHAPDEYGLASYDADDVEVLQTLRHLGALGIPEPVLLDLSAAVARCVERLHHEISCVFKDDDARWPSEERADFVRRTRDNPGLVARDLRLVNEYAQHRTIQRMVLETLRTWDGPAPTP